MKRYPALLLALAAAAFIAVLVHLFQLRFASGDIHPAYSSLRTDPIGVKALHDSLDQLLPTRRNFAPLDQLHHGRDSVLFHLGTDTRHLDFRNLELFVNSGGRLVVAFTPIHSSSALPSLTNTLSKPGPNNPTNPPPTGPEPDPGGEETQSAITAAVMERWGFSLAHEALDVDGTGYIIPAPARLMIDAALPPTILTHTALHFNNLSPAWRVVYDRVDDKPVVIERNLGGGTVVLCADSFLLSNQALLQEREPQLLAWFGGQAHSVIFDETHLGVAEDPGVVTLMRRYQLHGVVGALLLLALLFIWRNALSFLPPHEHETTQAGRLVQGRDSSAGFVNLLRRNIRPDDLLAVCLAEWKQACSQGKSPARLNQIQAVIDEQNLHPPRERSPIQTYQTISRILAPNPNAAPRKS